MNADGMIRHISEDDEKEIGERMVNMAQATARQQREMRVMPGDHDSKLGKQLTTHRSTHKRALKNQAKRDRKKGY